MKQQLANYTVVFEKQKRMGTDISCYMAYVPILGIATEGDTLEETEREIQSLIQFHIQSLVEEGKQIAVESHPSLVTRLEVLIPKGALLSS